MRRLLAFVAVLLLIMPFASAYGVTFYNPAWNPQDGKVFELVEPDQLYVFNVKNADLSMTKVSFMIDREAKNGGVTIYSLQSIPDRLPELDEETTYDLIEVKYSGFVPHDTTKFLYEFKVAKGWLENNSIPRNAIALHAYDRVLEVWDVLPTEVKSDDDDFVYFSAADDGGVHYLFIGRMLEGYDGSMVKEGVEDIAEAEPAPAEPAPVTAQQPVDMSAEVETVDLTPEPTPVAAPAPAPTPAPPAPISEAPVEKVKSERDNSRLIGALILLSLAVIVVILYLVLGRKKLGYSVDKELNSYVKESLKRGKTRDEVRQRLLEVGWHHDRVEKALAKHTKHSPAKHSEPKKESMSLAEAKALAAKQKKDQVKPKNAQKSRKKR